MRGKMKAQVFYEPEDMRLEEVNIPTIAEDEALIKVRACSICGSDIAYRGCQSHDFELLLSRKQRERERERNLQDFNKKPGKIQSSD